MTPFNYQDIGAQQSAEAAKDDLADAIPGPAYRDEINSAVDSIVAAAILEMCSRVEAALAQIRASLGDD